MKVIAKKANGRSKKYKLYCSSVLLFIGIYIVSYDFLNQEQTILANLSTWIYQMDSLLMTTSQSNFYDRNTTRCIIDFKMPDRSNKPMAVCYVEHPMRNFGDELGPAVVKQLLDRYFRPGCEHSYTVLNLANKTVEETQRENYSCFFTVGSALHYVEYGDSIWGTGANPIWQAGIAQNKVPSNVTVYATRGPKTWDDYFQKQFPEQKMYSKRSFFSLRSRKVNNYGDAGFLIPYIYSQYNKGRKKTDDTTTREFCVVPHFQEQFAPVIQNVTMLGDSSNVVKVISPHNKWEDAVSQLQMCNYIMSSSLHGLILADALGIPNMWFQIPGEDTERLEGNFKYLDYYSGLLKGQPDRKPAPGFDQIFNTSAYLDPPSAATRRKYVDNLVRTFPFHIFERTYK